MIGLATAKARIAAAVGALALVAVGTWWVLASVYSAGRSAAQARCAAAAAAAEADLAGREAAVAEQLRLVGTAGALRQAHTETRFRVLEREVVRYVENAPAAVRGCGLDDDGLRLWNTANAGAEDPAAASGGSGAVPAAAAGGGRPADHAVAQPRGDGAPVPRLQQPPAAPGGSPLDTAAAHPAAG